MEYLHYNYHTIDLSKEFNVNRDELIAIGSKKGSVKIAILVNPVLSRYRRIPVTYAYIKNKNKKIKESPNLKKYCIKSSQIKN